VYAAITEIEVCKRLFLLVKQVGILFLLRLFLRSNAELLALQVGFFQGFFFYFEIFGRGEIFWEKKVKKV